MQLSIELPFPPTTNHIWVPKKPRGMRRSDAYLAWIAEADKLFVMQKRGLVNQMLCGKIHCLLEIYTDDKRKRRDADNRLKAPLDYATRIGLIKDDSLIEKGTFLWTSPENAPPYGCRLTLWDAE